MSEFVVVVINALLFILFSVFVYLKRGLKNEATFTALIWAISSFFSILYLESAACHIYLQHLTLLPFIWLFVCFLISFIPLYRTNSISTSVPICNISVLKILIYIICITSFLPFVENLYYILSGHLNFYQLVESKDLGTTVDPRKHLSWLSARFASISLLTILVVPPFLFSYLRGNKIKKWIVAGLITSFLNVFFLNVINGNRNAIVQLTLYLIMNYLFFRKQYKTSVNKKILLALGSIGAIIVIFITFVSIYRFTSVSYSKQASPLEFFYLYAGESYCNFSGYAWGLDGTLGGKGTFGTILSSLGLEKANTNIAFKIPLILFYTSFGFLYLDYGVVIPIIILFVISLFFWGKKKNIKFSKYLLLNAWWFFIINSMWYNPYANFWNSLWMLLLIVVILKINKC